MRQSLARRGRSRFFHELTARQKWAPRCLRSGGGEARQRHPNTFLRSVLEVRPLAVGPCHVRIWSSTPWLDDQEARRLRNSESGQLTPLARLMVAFADFGLWCGVVGGGWWMAGQGQGQGFLSLTVGMGGRWKDEFCRETAAHSVSEGRAGFGRRSGPRRLRPPPVSGLMAAASVCERRAGFGHGRA